MLANEVEANIIDVCQRVFGASAKTVIQQSEQGYHIQVCPVKRADRLTLAEQEMDVIMCLQHLLSGASIQLSVI